MLIIGLTGSIATGKSTVSSLLSRPPYNLTIIDADLLARQVVEPGTSGYRAIVSHFGDSILLPAEDAPSSTTTTGTDAIDTSITSTSTSKTKSRSKSKSKPRPIDRAALGRLVFSSSAEAQANRRTLNSIVHPRVRLRMVLGVLRAWILGQWAVVLDVPLLFESGLDIFCGSVLVVGVSSADEQLQRLLARDAKAGGSLTQAEARGRVESQGRMEWKVSRVDARRDAVGEQAAEVVWNDGSRDDLERGLAAVVGRWRRASPRWWCLLLWIVPPVALGVAFWWFVRGWWVRRRCLRQEKMAEKGK